MFRNTNWRWINQRYIWRIEEKDGYCCWIDRQSTSSNAGWTNIRSGFTHFICYHRLSQQVGPLAEQNSNHDHPSAQCRHLLKIRQDNGDAWGPANLSRGEWECDLLFWGSFQFEVPNVSGCSLVFDRHHSRQIKKQQGEVFCLSCNLSKKSGTAHIKLDQLGQNSIDLQRIGSPQQFLYLGCAAQKRLY